MNSDYESDEEFELQPFGKIKDIEFKEDFSDTDTRRRCYQPIDWDEIDSVIERRCKSCEKFREEKNYGEGGLRVLPQKRFVFLSSLDLISCNFSMIFAHFQTKRDITRGAKTFQWGGGGVAT